MHPAALKPKKPRKPPGLTGLSLAGLAPETSFVLTDTGSFQKGGFRINAAGVQGCPMKKGDLSSITLEQLEPLQTLGSGACGTVRLARHTPSGQLLALKVINIGDQSQRHQLLNELGVLVSLSHPHLVPLFDAFYCDGQVHIALAYMDGGSLAQLLSAHQRCQAAQAQRADAQLMGDNQRVVAQLVGLPERVLAYVLVQMLCGLQHLHSHGVVHRDIKPANILFDSAGVVRVADFGIAKQLEGVNAPMASSFVGTAAYMAPERMAGHAYSFGADVWAVGVLVVESAQGGHPYAEGEYELVLGLANGAAPPRLPAELFSPELCALCASCCALEPGARATIDALLQGAYMRRYCGGAVTTSGVPDASAEAALHMAAAAGRRLGEWLRATWPQAMQLGGVVPLGGHGPG